MSASFDIWKVVAGIAVLLLGMNFLEEALQRLAGRPFKLFLKRQTSNKLKAIVGGAIVTALLQSSSVVNLMVLAFVGAGVIKMQSALAVILGANLGTTFNSWILATVGFKFDIESFAFPITGIFGILMVLLNKENRLHSWSKLLLGLGFLFIGLGFMKTGIEEMVKGIDIGALGLNSTIIFFIFGLLITSIVQSSSVAVAIALSALHANAITLLAATAIVLGSEIGTSLKLVLASVKGLSVKRRVALGNLLFNLVPSLLIFFVLEPINYFITEKVGIKDSLIALVFFQSLVNGIGIILFFPFLDIFGKFLENRFVNTGNNTLLINKVNVKEADLAMAAYEKDIKHFVYYVSEFVFATFGKPVPVSNYFPRSKDFSLKTVMGKYEYIKYLHGEMNKYHLQLRNNLTDKDATARLEQLIAVTRNAMFAAKSLKDAMADIDQLRNSSNNTKYGFYRQTEDRVFSFYEQLLTLLLSDKPESYIELITAMYNSIQSEYNQRLQSLYAGGTIYLTEIEFSTLVNFNWEIYTSFKSLLFSIKDLLLNDNDARHFDEFPEFIR